MTIINNEESCLYKRQYKHLKELFLILILNSRLIFYTDRLLRKEMRLRYLILRKSLLKLSLLKNGDAIEAFQLKFGTFSLIQSNDGYFLSFYKFSEEISNIYYLESEKFYLSKRSFEKKILAFFVNYSELMSGKE